ncbi:hypothetical protein CEE39_07995 [bacterium (candidate division B38) B3_B38]|nr:MAG: hypothetical protein CEE39_07995 [bacterium (candidate division B38) B3_B38]
MQKRDQIITGKLSVISKTATVETTLYDLIEAVSKEVKSGEDHLVSMIVKDMLYTNRAVSRLQ